ncbi:hypothetical protein [Kineosporia succinea]|uniref:Uncharacterized protein n=1 Tax=Kineosporia succinea TaxID=84632 RepID=A0ABT9P3K5_9ACTN|nr:hypothetical protein [Kineosporia succinea]MDP9827057.1 hypothetical protein [Kineosporia succinea]
MEYVAAIFPSIGVLALFVIAIRAIFQADRRERLAQAAEDRRLDAAEKSGNGQTAQTHTSQSVKPADSV